MSQQPDEQEVQVAQERRQAPRFLVSLGAEVRIGSRTFLGSISELSRSGAFVELWDRNFGEEGTVVLACAAFGDPIEVSIRSRRVREGAVRGIGVEFGTLSAEVAARLGRFIGLLAP